MPHGYIDRKKIVELGEALLEEAILAVLAEAQDKNMGPLKNGQINELVGTHCLPADYGIVRVLTSKLNDGGKISNLRGSGTYSNQEDLWKLADPPP